MARRLLHQSTIDLSFAPLIAVEDCLYDFALFRIEHKRPLLMWLDDQQCFQALKSSCKGCYNSHRLQALDGEGQVRGVLS